ncbi:MAG: hypothetical protein GY821_11210 [Gammaproteobacteria bacterium]|nr:hypothetical protein [Gammaproteobacteria bacterium]
MQKLVFQHQQQNSKQVGQISSTLQQGFFNNTVDNFNKHSQTSHVDLDAMDDQHPHFLLMQKLNIIHQLDNGLIYSGQPGWEQSPQRVQTLSWTLD